jgi:Domain of unknown function (DUF4293)
MIQRIQTIYLFLAATAGFGVLALPFASTPEVVQSSALFSDNLFSTSDNIGLLVLFALAGALAIGSIFLFNNRKVQLKISWAALLANLFGFGLAGFLFFQDKARLGSSTVNGGVGAFLPIAFILFVFLAIKGIKKDESIVKSADRLR